MKTKKNVCYFPVDGGEQEILHRLREPDLAPRVADLLAMLDLIAEAKLAPADLEEAVRLLEESRQGEGLEARFENLEARLTARIEKRLTEIEGRVSRRIGDSAPGTAPLPPAEITPPHPPSVATAAKKPGLTAGPPTPPPQDPVPADADLAFRVGAELVWGESAAQFYIAVWKWLFDHGRVSLAPGPVGNSHRVVHGRP